MPYDKDSMIDRAMREANVSSSYSERECQRILTDYAESRCDRNFSDNTCGGEGRSSSSRAQNVALKAAAEKIERQAKQAIEKTSREKTLKEAITRAKAHVTHDHHSVALHVVEHAVSLVVEHVVKDVAGEIAGSLVGGAILAIGTLQAPGPDEVQRIQQEKYKDHSGVRHVRLPEIASQGTIILRNPQSGIIEHVMPKETVEQYHGTMSVPPHRTIGATHVAADQISTERGSPRLFFQHPVTSGTNIISQHKPVVRQVDIEGRQRGGDNSPANNVKQVDLGRREREGDDFSISYGQPTNSANHVQSKKQTTVNETTAVKNRLNVNALLELIVEGKQNEADAMLRQNRELALASGEVTDPAGRKFDGITALQLAVWNLDWHMWEMLLQHMSAVERYEQSKRLNTGSWVLDHGLHANWQNLIDAYQICIDSPSDGGGGWTRVGSAQKKLPVHVLQEFCQPSRSFIPCPNFRETSLQRVTQLGNGNSLSWKVAGGLKAIFRHSQEHATTVEMNNVNRWLTVTPQYDTNRRYRYLGPKGLFLGNKSIMNPEHKVVALADQKACMTLLNTRMTQRQDMIIQISNCMGQQLDILTLVQQQKRDIASLVKQRDVNIFLKLVVDGKQSEAKTMLSKNLELVVGSGTVVDHAGRIFENITALQLAIWCLDWHMWEMLLAHMRINGLYDVACFQATKFKTGDWVSQHGVHVNWQRLLDAYQAYIDLINSKELAAWVSPNTRVPLDKMWLEKIGGAQRELPMHAIQEYCHPSRSFDPCPDFTVTDFPRTTQLRGGLQVDFLLLSTAYSLTRQNIPREAIPAKALRAPNETSGVDVMIECFALATLYITRCHQREILVARLNCPNDVPQSAVIDSKVKLVHSESKCTSYQFKLPDIYTPPVAVARNRSKSHSDWWSTPQERRELCDAQRNYSEGCSMRDK